MEYSESKAGAIAIDTEYQRRRYTYRITKRVFDFVASLIGLILLSPVFLIVAIAIKIEDHVDQCSIHKRGWEGIKSHLKCLSFGQWLLMRIKY